MRTITFQCFCGESVGGRSHGHGQTTCFAKENTDLKGNFPYAIATCDQLVSRRLAIAVSERIPGAMAVVMLIVLPKPCCPLVISKFKVTTNP